MKDSRKSGGDTECEVRYVASNFLPVTDKLPTIFSKADFSQAKRFRSFDRLNRRWNRELKNAHFQPNIPDTKIRAAYNSTAWRGDGGKRNFRGPKRQISAERRYFQRVNKHS